MEIDIINHKDIHYEFFQKVSVKAREAYCVLNFVK